MVGFGMVMMMCVCHESVFTLSLGRGQRAIGGLAEGLTRLTTPSPEIRRRISTSPEGRGEDGIARAEFLRYHNPHAGVVQW